MGIRQCDVPPETWAKLLAAADRSGATVPSAAVGGAGPSLCPPRPGALEKEFQAAVVRLAESHGWRVYHTHYSRRSAAGYPDLTLVRKGVLILAELKTDKGRTSAAQDEWLRELRVVPGVRTRLWRPALWSAIVAELTAPSEQPVEG